MAITLRRLREEESPLLKELYLRMSIETPTAFGDTAEELSVWSDEKWQAMATEFATSPISSAFVAEDAARAHGFVTTTIPSWRSVNTGLGKALPDNPDDPSDTTLMGRMWVAPEHRGQGLAHALIQRVFAWAKEKNQRKVVLGCTEGNEQARRCYVRAGFVPMNMTLPHPNFEQLSIEVMECDV
jgi:RimJ/RimL family protein N-acetyltransferase